MAIMRSMKASPGIDGHAHDQPVGQHPRAAGDRGEIAARFADHRRGFAGDRALIDRRHAFDHLAVRRDDIAGFDQEQIALAQIPLAWTCCPFATPCVGSVSFLACTDCFRPRSDAACALLRPSASASAKFANSTVNHSHSGDGENEARAVLRPGRAAPAGTAHVVRMLPTYTTNITGLRNCTRGDEFAKRIRDGRAHAAAESNKSQRIDASRSAVPQ